MGLSSVEFCQIADALLQQLAVAVQHNFSWKLLESQGTIDFWVKWCFIQVWNFKAC